MPYPLLMSKTPLHQTIFEQNYIYVPQSVRKLAFQTDHEFLLVGTYMIIVKSHINKIYMELKYFRILNSVFMFKQIHLWTVPVP